MQIDDGVEGFSMKARKKKVFDCLEFIWIFWRCGDIFINRDKRFCLYVENNGVRNKLQHCQTKVTISYLILFSIFSIQKMNLMVFPWKENVSIRIFNF